LLATLASGASAQESEWPGAPGPTQASLGAVAQIQVPSGCQFLDPTEARAALESMGNPTSQRELGMVVQTDENWFVVFEYSETGHIKDDDKHDLDADALLETLREGNEQGNKLRAERGWAPVNLVGWAQPPHYDERTHNLEWATRAQSESEPIINYNTRILGRLGVMEVTLVCGPEQLQTVLPSYKSLLDGYDYKSGHRYAEFRAGDKMASYGLTALVAGGAGALAVKSGLLGKLWKVVAVAAVAVAGFVKKLFSKKSAQPAGS
jgi:uncharacterized membrane-anchored protein